MHMLLHLLSYRCKTASVSVSFDIQPYGFCVVFGRKAVEKTVEKTADMVLSILARDPKCTTLSLAGLTGLTRRGVEWSLRRLKEQGKIRRVGPDKGGYWEIL